MKILVVGAKGFIGSHCLSYFRARGHEVTGCDVAEANEANYFSVASVSNDFNKVFSSQKFDYCINAAGSAHVNYSFEFPEKDFEQNVFLVINLLGAIKNNQPECRYINFSSAAVYGNPVQLPISESAETRPLSPYGYHKLLSEKLLFEYYKFFGLKTCSLRVFSAYGEGLRKQLFWDLAAKIRNKDSITLYGTGNESRDFIYIGDLLNIVDVIIRKAPFTGETYNVANGEEVSIRDAVKVFVRQMSWPGTVIFSGEERIGDPLNWRADISRISELGYKRQYSFEEGLNKYCEWLKEGA